MKKICAFVAAFGLFLSIGFSQNTVAIGYSTNAARFGEGDVTLYEDACLAGITQSKQCKGLARREWEAILKEKGIQKTEDFLKGNIAPQGESLGADYLILLTMQSLESKDERSTDNDGKSSRTVNATLIISVKAVDVRTGEVGHNKVISINESASGAAGTGTYSASERDIVAGFKESFVKKFSFQLSTFMYELFPPDVKIVKIEETDKKGNKAKAVLVKSSSPLPENAFLDIYMVYEESIDGEIMTRKIDYGRLKIKNVESEKLALCVVKSKAEEIFQAFTDQKQLKCTVSFETGWLPQINLPFKIN